MNKKTIMQVGTILFIIVIFFFIIYNRFKSREDSNQGIDFINSYSIEVKTNDKTIEIPINKITILYDSLIRDLDLHSISDIKVLKYQLGRITPEIVYSDNDIYYILINYNCGGKLCDYLFLKYNTNEDLQYIYLDFGLYYNSKISTQGNLIAFNFQQEVNIEVYNNIVVVDLNKFEVMQLEDLPKSYTYKVISYDWIRNKLHVQFQEDDNTKIITISN